MDLVVNKPGEQKHFSDLMFFLGTTIQAPMRNHIWHHIKQSKSAWILGWSYHQRPSTLLVWREFRLKKAAPKRWNSPQSPTIPFMRGQPSSPLKVLPVKNKGFIRPYWENPMVNKPLIRHSSCGGYGRAGRLTWLTSHDLWPRNGRSVATLDPLCRPSSQRC